jgi:hypothetical protein
MIEEPGNFPQKSPSCRLPLGNFPQSPRRTR